MTNKLSNEDHPSYLIGLFNGCWSTKLSSEHYLNWVVDNCGILWPIIAITIVVFLVWSEYGSQDCRNQQCNNKAPVINKNDSPQQIIDKIMITSRKNHTLVSWRRAMLIAIIFGILILIIIGFAIAYYLREIIKNSQVKGGELISQVVFYFILYIFGVYTVKTALISLDEATTNWIIIILTAVMSTAIAFVFAKKELRGKD